MNVMSRKRWFVLLTTATALFSSAYSETTTNASAISTTPSDTSGNLTTPVGTIKCAFRYSFPVGNDVQSEKNGGSTTKQKKDNKDGTPTTGSLVGGGVGSTDSDVPLPNTGTSEDSGNGAVTPKPITVAPGPTKHPSSTTVRPSPTTVAPDTGSTNGLRRLEDDDADAADEVEPTKAPTKSKTKQPTTAPTTVTSSTSEPPSTTEPPSTPPATTKPSSTNTSQVITGEFTCDATFYSAWKHLNLKCGTTDLDVQAATQHAKCLLYGGAQQAVVDIKMCVSLCKFPKCTNGTWDYMAEDGFTSKIYNGLDLVKLVTFAGISTPTLPSQVNSVFSSLHFKTDRQCTYLGDSSLAECQCENVLPQNNSIKTAPPALRPLVDKGLEDYNHWGDGVPKAAIDKVGIGAATMGGSAAALSVAVGGVMTVAGGVMGTGAGVVSAGASMTLAMATVDFCQFGVMVNQMNLDATPRVLQELGKRMSPSTFSFLPFGQVSESDESDDTESESDNSRRRLNQVNVTPSTPQDGMTRYAQLIGVQVDMLFYLTLAGILLLCIVPFILFGIILLLCMPFVSDLKSFACKWFDKAVGVLMMVLILSEYVIGVTATFQIYHSITVGGRIDVGAGLAIFALLFVAIGTICWGYYVVHNYEEELKDLGTKNHLEKSVYNRYGPLYDEYTFESRFFFAPKLLLALGCGITTGLSCIPGLWQVIVLITLHIIFLLYLEVKQPYPSQFVQKSSSFVIIIKISALFLTLFLLSSTSGIQKDLPVDLRQGVGFAIIGLQVLVLIALLIRQIFIFYRTWKLKRTKTEEKEIIIQPEDTFIPLGGDLHSMYDHNTQLKKQEKGTSL